MLKYNVEKKKIYSQINIHIFGWFYLAHVCVLCICNKLLYFRLYTSVPLANFLLENSITVCGTVNKIRRGIPPHMTNVTGRPQGDYQILYEEGGKLSLHSWTVKPKKGIANFSSTSNPHFFYKPFLVMNVSSFSSLFLFNITYTLVFN